MINWFQKKQMSKQRDGEKKRTLIDCFYINDYFKEVNIYNKKGSRIIKRKDNKKFRKGSTVIIDTFILIVSLLIITLTTMFMVNILTPFIYYQKLQMTTQKYMYIIERYGNLTKLEVSEMYKELENQGFQKDKLKICPPNDLIDYGEEIVFEVKYTHIYKVPKLDWGISTQEKNIDLIVRKVSISKK